MIDSALVLLGVIASLIIGVLIIIFAEFLPSITMKFPHEEQFLKVGLRVKKRLCFNPGVALWNVYKGNQLVGEVSLLTKDKPYPMLIVYENASLDGLYEIISKLGYVLSFHRAK